jgi:competence protein ComEC
LVIIFAFLLYTVLVPKPKYASVKFLDVGQGDAALITTPSNQRILIDGGPNDAVMARLDKTIPFYERRLDAVILTHPHSDHLNGLIKVLKTYEVKKIYMTGVLHTTPEYIEFLDEIKAKNLKAENVTAGKELELSDGIKLNFLYPYKNLVGQKVENLNNSSIVTRLVWNKSSFIFMGDLEAEAQTDLLKQNANVQSEVIKIAHHGSKDSANKTFLEKVNPRIAVISVGKDNKFGHPSEQALDLLKSVKVFRTDQDGNIRCDFSETKIDCAPTLN